MKILLHTCCAPCSCYSVDKLREQGHEVVAYFSNPNIHPFSEYQKRKKAMEQYAEKTGLDVIYDGYNFEDYFRKINFNEDNRCRLCYHLRLKRTVARARKDFFDAFSTTLIYSKYQKHEIIKEVAEGLSNEYNVPFYYYDFREGWQEGIDKSKEMELYRQKYCGCLFSEYERYSEK